MFCPNCGTKNEPGAVFCSNCGQRLEEDIQSKSSQEIHEPLETQLDDSPYPSRENHPAKASKKAKIIIAVIVVLLVVGAGAGYYIYSQNQTSQTGTIASSQSSSTTNSSVSSSDSTSATMPALWSTSKNSELSDFMSSWQEGMNQSYLGTYNGQSVKMNGVTLPKDIKNGNYHNQITVNGNDATLKWTTKANTDAEYQVVAASVYSHEEDGQNKMIAYLYVFDNQQPEVLVSQDADSSVMNFTPTENQDLQDGFAGIANE